MLLLRYGFTFCILLVLQGCYCLDEADEAADLLEAAFQLNEVPKKLSNVLQRRIVDAQSHNEQPEDIEEMKSVVDILGKSTSSLLGGLLGGGDFGGFPLPIGNARSSIRTVRPRDPLGEDGFRKSINEDEQTRGNSIRSFLPFFETLSQLPMKLTNLQGPHICVKESKTIEETSFITSSNETEPEPEMTEITSKCQRLRDASVCTNKAHNGKITKRIQDCCEGYTTNDITKYGCDQEINDKFLQSHNLTRSDFPQGATLLSSNSFYTIPGVQNVYDWTEKQVLTTSNSAEKFVVHLKDELSVDIYLNCALKKETIRLGNSQVLTFDRNLKPAEESLLEVIKKNSNLSKFLEALGDDLQEFLREINGATVFAFTNEAFDRLSESTKQQILNPDKEGCVQELMKQHISTTGSYCSDNLPRSIESLTGNALSVRRNRTQIKIEEASIIESDSVALNGVLHIVDQVMVREDFLTWRDSLKLYNPELAAKLENEKLEMPVTIFVPPRDNSSEITNPRNYIVSNRLITKFETPSTFQTDENSTIFTGPPVDDESKMFSMRLKLNAFSLKNDGRVACSRFVAAPIHSCKTVIHFIDKPLPVIHQNIEEFLASRTDLSKFYRLWKASNVTTGLNRVTVFAPSDDAFAENVFKKIEKSKKRTNDFVSRHIVKSIICGSDIQKSTNEVRSTMYTTLNGEVISPNYEEQQPGINNAKIQTIELVQSNGIVHILDAYLEKSRRNINTVRMPTSQIISSPFSLFSHLLGRK